MNKFATRKSLYGMVTAAALSLLLVGPSLAADGTTATVTGGTLSITNPLADNFTGTNVTGAAQTTTAALAAFSVSDLRGSGVGWNVTAQASQFTVAGAGGKTLAAGSLTLSAPTVASPNTTSADPSIVAGPYTIDGASAVKFTSAAVNAGMGTYDYSATTMTLALPADVFAGAYDSTVTISVVTAP